MIKNKYILVVLLIVYFLLSNKNLYDTLFVDIGHNSIIKLLFFLFVTVIFFLSFFIFFLIKNTYIRVSTGLIFLISSFASQFFYDISGNIININDIEIAILNKSSIYDLVINYRKDFFLNFSIFIFGFCLLINGIRSFNFFNKKQIYFSLIFFFSLFSISSARGGFATQGLPSQLQVLIPLPLIFFSKNFEYSNQKLSFDINNKNKNIILIIDESVSFKYFVKAKNFEKNIDKHFKYLKKFYSIHNCSAQAVFGLMNGIEVTKDNIVLRKSLWLRAKEANYKTIYFSAQEKPGNYQYLQNIKEIINIDEKYFFSHLKNKDRDRELLDKLLEVIAKDNNQFIVVIKNGSHFPYFDKFDLKKFNLDKNSDANLIYTYSIKENSINFLKDLLSKLKKDSDIIYLSDHGQLLKKKKLSHCNSNNPEIQEWEIPLLYYKNNKNRPLNVNSNLYLYDFIINKMGYSNEINLNRENKLFYGNLNKRLNKQTKFITLK
ncbi:MAG: sulfatase-like hydrolase/transferase [Alphaproteobacteria bacterium]